MLLRVDCYAGHRGEETPRRFFLDHRPVEVVEIIDQWLETDYRYFKVRGDDGAVYVLRNAAAVEGPTWELDTHPIYCVARLNDGD